MRERRLLEVLRDDLRDFLEAFDFLDLRDFLEAFDLREPLREVFFEAFLERRLFYRHLDFTILKDFINLDEDIRGKTEDVYDFLLEYKKSQEFNITSTKKIIEFLFDNKILIPITEDFMRFHKSNYKYEKTDEKTREDTKIKYIINIVNKVRNFHSKTYKTNPKLKVAVKDLFFKQLADRDAILYNALEENNSNK